MGWVVDSCVLLDIATANTVFGPRSVEIFDKLTPEGLLACPISLIEIAPYFGGQIANIRQFLYNSRVSDQAPWLTIDTETAAAAWTRYVAIKHQKSLPKVEKRPLADLLIGSFASRHQGLITRNASHFRPYFPGLTILEP